MAVLAPIPSPSMSTATQVNPGDFRSVRKLCRASRRNDPIGPLSAFRRNFQGLVTISQEVRISWLLELGRIEV